MSRKCLIADAAQEKGALLQSPGTISVTDSDPDVGTLESVATLSHGGRMPRRRWRHCVPAGRRSGGEADDCQRSFAGDFQIVSAGRHALLLMVAHYAFTGRRY